MRQPQPTRRRPGVDPRAPRPALVPAAVVTIVLGLVAVACGGSSGGAGVATAGGTRVSDTSDDASKDPEQAGLEFARCMREHGVDVPDPEPGQGGLVKIGPGPAGGGGGGPSTNAQASPGVAINGGAFEEAQKACEHLLEGLLQDGARQLSPEDQDRAIKHAQCMREHGVPMPDPTFEGGAISVRLDGVDPTSPTFQAAQEACREVLGLPAGGPGGLVARSEAGRS